MSWKRAGVNFIRMAILLVLVSMAAFFLVSVSPLDPLATNVGQAALGSMSSEQIARLQEYWGVNTPPDIWPGPAIFLRETWVSPFCTAGR